MEIQTLSLSKEQKIYAECVKEASSRLLAAKQYFASDKIGSQIPDLEPSILQVRKSIEAIANGEFTVK